MEETTTRSITLELSADTYADLAVLVESGDPAEALLELCERVSDGVHRPGSWERPWLLSVFYDFEKRLEDCPTAPWRQRPVEVFER